MKKKLLTTGVLTIVLCLVGWYIFFNSDSKLPSVKGLFTQSKEGEATPQPTDIAKDDIPSERALKAATYVYYTDNGENQEWINKAFQGGLTQYQIDQFRTGSSQQGYSETEIEAEIKRKQGEKALTKLALWLDENPNNLVQYEVAINKHQQSLQNQYVQQPVQYYAPDNQVNDFQYQIDEQKRKLQWELDEQKSKLEDLQSDLRMDCIRAGGSPIGNKCY